MNDYITLVILLYIMIIGVFNMKLDKIKTVFKAGYRLED